MNSGSVTNVKVWPLDADGNKKAERPSYHCFPIDDGFWVILRSQSGWNAWFYEDDE